MILFSFYKPDTGEIVMTSSLSDASRLDAAEEMIGLPGVRNDALLQGYVRDGTVVPFPERPSPLHVFNYATEAWEDGPLSERKALRWTAIKAQRDALEAGGFSYLGKQVDSGALSVQRISTFSQAAQAGLGRGEAFAVDWTCADNTVLRLDAAAMVAMAVALAAHANALHETARSLRARIDVAPTPAEVDAVIWPN